MLELGLLALLFLALVLCLPFGGASMPWRRPSRDAEARAEALLRELLSEAEYRQLSRDGYLAVPSRVSPDRTYRVPRDGGLVRVYEGGRPVMALCVQPTAPLPGGDVVLLHKLLIEGDEDAYLRVANHLKPGPGLARRGLARR